MSKDETQAAGQIVMMPPAALLKVNVVGPVFLVFRDGPLAPLSCTHSSVVENYEVVRGWIGWFVDMPLRALASAPRDRTSIFVFDKMSGLGTVGIEARAGCWVTDEFIPSEFDDNDRSGMNHGAIPDEAILGWLPLPEGLAGTTNVAELHQRLPSSKASGTSRAPGAMTEANADLMGPIAEILNASKKDLPTKVGVLVDAAAALLATSKRMRRPGELRLTSEEMRKRLIKVTRAHQLALAERQQKAMAEIEAFSKGTTKAPVPEENDA